MTTQHKAHNDEVDDIVAAWRDQRPDVDTSPMQVLSRISRLSRHLDLARRRAFATHDLDPWAFDVLSALRRAGAPYARTPGTLMTDLLVTSGTMTNRIDRLEEAGLVTRTPSPTDRRAILVVLTPAGLERVDAALITLLECEREILAPLDDDTRERLAHRLRDLLLPFDR